MSVRNLRLVLFLLLASGTFLLGGATQLNPTVKLLPRPSGPVPAECDESLAPQPAQRVQVTEVVEQPRDTSRDLEPPPSRDLRSQIRDAQAAAEGNDRERFKQALASSKALLNPYPPGAERNGAVDVISVYDDLGRLWDYQFDTPAGSFFDAASGGGALLSAMTRYRGYEDFIRRQVLVVNGNRIYPTRETREFLTREAAQRLNRLGFPTPPKVATPVEKPRETVVSKSVVSTPVLSKPTPAPPREATSTPKPRTRKSSTSSTAGRRTAVKPRPTEPTPGPSIVGTSTTAPVEPTTRTKTSTRQPIDVPVIQTTATETTAIVAPFERMPTDTMSAPDTSATTSAPTTTTATPAQGKGRNIILPLMLILIGIGVLIVLFRASS